MAPNSEITRLIPHRPPFLWVDRIISFGDNVIETEKTIPPDLEIFAGHFPGNPILPGVLLCEAIFQSGALLIAKIHQGSDNSAEAEDPGEPLVPVLTRIGNAKFKRNILPGDIVRIRVQLLETLGKASYFKGNLKKDGKTAVQIEFACAMISAAA